MAAAFFEVKISPRQKYITAKAVSEKHNDNDDDDDAILILSPFNRRPIINFKHTKLGITSVKQIRILNPRDTFVEVRFCDLPDPKYGLKFCNNSLTIDPGKQTTVNVSWTPIEYGIWHHTVKVVTDSGAKYSFAVTCKSVKPEKSTNQKPSKQFRSTTFAETRKQLKKTERSSKIVDRITAKKPLKAINTQLEEIPWTNETHNLNQQKVSNLIHERDSRRETFSVFVPLGKENVCMEANVEQKCAENFQIAGRSDGSTDFNFGAQTTQNNTSFDKIVESLCFTPDINKNTATPKVSTREDITLNKRFGMHLTEKSYLLSETEYIFNDQVTKVETRRKEISTTLSAQPLSLKSPDSEVYSDSLEEATECLFAHENNCSFNERKLKIGKNVSESCVSSEQLWSLNDMFDGQFDTVEKFTHAQLNIETKSELSEFLDSVPESSQAIDFVKMSNQQLEAASSPPFCSTPFKISNFDLSPIKSTAQMLTFDHSMFVTESSDGNVIHDIAPIYDQNIVSEELNTTFLLKSKASLSAIDEESIDRKFEEQENIYKDTFHEQRIRHSPATKVIITSGAEPKQFLKPRLKKILKSPLRKQRSSKSAVKSGIKKLMKQDSNIIGLHTLKLGQVDNNVLKKQVNDVSCRNTFFGNIMKPNLMCASLHDPFFCSNNCNDLTTQEREFIQWLNSLLTLPPELNNSEISVDVAKLWKETTKKRIVDSAPSLESVSLQHHKNDHLNSLRKAAKALLHSENIKVVMSKVIEAVDKKAISIREDKAILQDVGLQKYILELFLCYSPLWLRIALETVCGVLLSSSRIQDLMHFIVHNFLEDSNMKQRYSNPKVINFHHPEYVKLMKRRILKRFFTLVLFLDEAKENKLIGYDPCLFRKNAMFKSSRDVLLAFSRELLAGVGDIMKHLRLLGYVVKHEQKYIHEYDYAVSSLLDLRDGVRLCRVMEIILKDKEIMKKLRVPAVSRLQKIHNVSLAFSSLQSSDFVIMGDISSRNIVDGHREKILSLLWQIIYKFQLPQFEMAATKIQRWWHKILFRKIKKTDQKRIASAITIQRWYRNIMHTVATRKYYQELKQSTIFIQQWYRSVRLMKKQRVWYCMQRSSAIIIQKWFRNIICSRILRHNFQKFKECVIRVQHWYRTAKEMRKQRASYLRQRSSALIIQKWFRSINCTRVQRRNYQKIKESVIIIQHWYRSAKEMRKQRNLYCRQQLSALTIQKWFRSILCTKMHQNNYQKLKQSVIKIQCWYRAMKLMKYDMYHYSKQRTSAIVIQRWYRAVCAGRIQRSYYLNLKKCAVTIQKWFRSLRSTRMEELSASTSDIKCAEYDKFEKLSIGSLEHSSAVKIQALWKGYRVRKNNANSHIFIRGTLSSRARQSEETLSTMYTKCLICFGTSSIARAIITFTSLGNLTGLSNEISRDFAKSDYLPKIFELLRHSNRSSATHRACSLGVHVLLNLARLPENRDFLWKIPHCVSTICHMMSQSVRNHPELFTNCCKFLCLLAQDPYKANAMRENLDIKKKLQSFEQQCKKADTDVKNCSLSGSSRGKKRHPNKMRARKLNEMDDSLAAINCLLHELRLT